MIPTFRNTSKIETLSGPGVQNVQHSSADIALIHHELEQEKSAIYEVSSGDVTLTLLDLSHEDAHDMLPRLRSTWLYVPGALGLSDEEGFRSGGYFGGVYQEGLDLRRKRSLVLGNPVAVEVSRRSKIARAAIRKLDNLRAATGMSKLIDQVVKWSYLTEGTGEEEILEMIDCLRRRDASIVLDIRPNGQELGDEYVWNSADTLGDVLSCFQTIADAQGTDHLIFYGLAESELENSPLRDMDPETIDGTHIISRQGFFIFSLDFENEFPSQFIFPRKYLERFGLLNGSESAEIEDVFKRIDQIAKDKDELRIPEMNALGEDVEFRNISIKERSEAFIDEFVVVYKATFKEQVAYKEHLSIGPQSFDEEQLRELLADEKVEVFVSRNEAGDMIGFFLGTKEIQHGANNEYHVFNPNIEIDGERIGESDDMLLTLSLGVHPDYRGVFGNTGFLTILRYVMAYTDSRTFGGDVAFTWRNDFLMNLALIMGSGKQWVDVYNYMVTHSKPK